MLSRNHIPHEIGYATQPHTRHRFARDFSDDLPSFAVVRNPYTRVVSWYEWIRRLPRYIDISFDDFVLNRVQRGRARLAWTPQTEWTHSADGHTRLVGTILRYEHLEQDLRKLFPHMGSKFLHLNHGGISDHWAYYTEQTRSAVAESFSEDFINFGYDTK